MMRKMTVILLLLFWVTGCDTAESTDSTSSNAINSVSFHAMILEINGNNIIVQPMEGEKELRSSDKIEFSRTELEDIDVAVGDVVTITYSGEIAESYPAQIGAISWSIYEEEQ